MEGRQRILTAREMLERFRAAIAEAARLRLAGRRPPRVRRRRRRQPPESLSLAFALTRRARARLAAIYARRQVRATG
jgi:hypothetical protein